MVRRISSKWKKLLAREVLPRVEIPGQYVGGEWNVIVKDHAQVDLTFALCFPETYALGMSHLGMQILYHVLNQREDVVCERAFAPWVDLEAELRRREIPLISLETGTPLSEFDIVGFSVQYEMNYTNVLNMLELAGIPLLASERDEDDPLIIAGGVSAFTPEPLADFIDLFLVGDGEEEILRLVEVYKSLKGKAPRREVIEAVARKSSSWYAPAYYDFSFNEDGTISNIEAAPGFPLPVQVAVVANLEDAPFPPAPIVPNVEVVHDRICLEIMRGCPHHCCFCQARTLKHPVRTRSVEKLLQLAEASYHNTGQSEISLLSLSSSDYPKLQELLGAMDKRFRKRAVSISVPSLRAGAEAAAIPQVLASVRKSGITLAPEAGSEHLRARIGKHISDSDIFEAAREAYRSGWNLVKLYFMIGLPGETEDDIQAIADLIQQVSQLRREVGRGPARVNVTIAPFVPKPHTPFQWEAMASKQYLQEVVNHLKRSVRSRQTRLKVHNLERALLEAVFSRGDRRLGKVLLEAHRLGCTFDGWDEHFSFDRWLTAFERTGIEPAFYACRRRPEDEIFPWGVVNTGISKELLLKDRRQSLGGETSV